MTDKIEDVFVRHIHAYTPSQIADGILAGEFVRETEFVLAHEVERLRTFEAAHRQLLADLDTATRERDEARAWAAKLLATLEMVRDADNDCRVEGWATIPDAVRRSIDEALEAKP